MNIPNEAVEAAARAIAARNGYPNQWQNLYLSDAKVALAAAAPHLKYEADLMRWKLDALKAWADAMIDESYYPQYGADVKTILDIGSMQEAREVDAPKAKARPSGWTYHAPPLTPTLHNPSNDD